MINAHGGVSRGQDESEMNLEAGLLHIVYIVMERIERMVAPAEAVVLLDVVPISSPHEAAVV